MDRDGLDCEGNIGKLITTPGPGGADNLGYNLLFNCISSYHVGWSGGAMVLGKLPVPGRPTIWMIVGQGPIALAVGAGGGGLDIFTLLYPFSPFSPSLWETARYRLKYCLKGPLNPKQSINHHIMATGGL